jgi:hypothetical protein
MGVELQAESEQDISVVLTPHEPAQAASQPAFQPSAKLDEATVRAATLKAAQQGLDPFSMTIGDLNQGQLPDAPAKVQAETPVEVPEKFKKPTGEVDVEKLKTSTRQLDEAIQKKEAELQKSVDDYVKAYKEKEAKLRGDLGPKVSSLQRETAALNTPPVQQPTQQPALSMEELKARVAQDLQRDYVGTTFDLIELAVQQRLNQAIAPLKQDAEELRIERQDRQLRNNLQELADKDPRIMNETVFNAIQTKLQSDPDLWKLKNPHKAAWLEVKDEMRLGDVPNGNAAQPSMRPSPILGGGTPPPTPSSSDGTLSMDTLLQAAHQLGRDPRDGGRYDAKQQANMDRAAKELFDRLDRQARR